MITVTPGAAQQIRQASQQAQAEEMPLRIAAKLMVDGSIQYGMGFDDAQESDLQVTSEGVTILIAPVSQPLLKGTVLDFVELNPGEFQFIFINPNDTGLPPGSQQGSGCGTGGCGSGGCGSGGGCA